MLNEREENSVTHVDESVARYVRGLAKRGWSEREFEKNHLGYVSALCLDSTGSGEPQAAFERYWRTVSRLSSLLDRAQIDHVILKTRRHYPYADTNVDVFINEGAWESVREVLTQSSWRMPSASVRLKQRVIERAKIKLPPTKADVVAAHVYYAVSWRYQRDISFLAPDMIERVDLSAVAPEMVAECGEQRIPMPSRAADLLLHAAEIVFENYRMTLGEVMYFQWLLLKVSSAERKRVSQLARMRRAEKALQCVCARAQDVPREAHLLEGSWPQNLPSRELLGAWWERFGDREKKGLVWRLEEFLGYIVWASMYRAKRALAR